MLQVDLLCSFGRASAGAVVQSTRPMTLPDGSATSTTQPEFSMCVTVARASGLTRTVMPVHAPDGALKSQEAVDAVELVSTPEPFPDSARTISAPHGASVHQTYARIAA